MNTSCCGERRVILHVDMDHFFSAVEEREHPEFKGKPVVVGADPRRGSGRGVVKTCNYTARAFSIHSGMPITQAWTLCPHAIYVRGNYPLYKKVSKAIMRILEGVSPKFQPWGFDEAFLDVSSQVQEFTEATELAVSIKHKILWSENLTCSIGIAPNKLVAKIASDYDKPDGLTVVPESAVEKFLAPLPVRKMLWIGEKTEQRLHTMGIRTIGELARYDASILSERFGMMGKRYHRWANGLYESEVGGRRVMRRSIGHESTFSANTDDHDLIIQRLDSLCQRVHERLVKKKVIFKTVTVKLRYENFHTFSRGKTLPFFTNSLHNLQATVRKLTQGLLTEKKKIRLLGVRVSQLQSNKGQKFLTEVTSSSLENHFS